MERCAVNSIILILRQRKRCSQPEADMATTANAALNMYGLAFISVDVVGNDILFITNLIRHQITDI